VPSDRREDVPGFLERPRARPPAGASHLEEDAERSLRVGEARRETLDAGDAVHEAGDLRALEGFRDDADVGAAGELIGDDEALDAEAERDGGLLGGGDGEGPGPGVELAPEELGAHRGLAVRGEEEAVLRAPGAHRLQVVGDRRVAQHHHRIREVVAEQVPALRPRRARGHGPGNPLARGVQGQVEDLVEFHPLSS
jgi:hypothetical protein